MNKLSHRSIRMRNKRINGKRNEQSLAFMERIKAATIEELDRMSAVSIELWECIAIKREIARREGQKS